MSYGASSALGAAIDYSVKPGEDVYTYMRRVAEAQKLEIHIAGVLKKFDADSAAALAAEKASAAGLSVPPDAQKKVARDMGGGTSTTTMLMLAAGAGLALFMLMKTRKR
jgi:hypothetical protein